jgi:four helix bundle suffix protein
LANKSSTCISKYAYFDRLLAGLSEFVERAAPELAANAMVCVVNQAAYLLKRQLERQGQTFAETGGFTEKLYGARSQAKRSDKSDTSYASDLAAKPPAPACPLCGHPMVHRIARKGPRANQPFWGCSRYPDCKGTLAVSPSEKSDQSDTSANSPKETP